MLSGKSGISFEFSISLNNDKVSEFGKKIINEKYLEATNSNKLFGSESLPNITNHYSMGGKILPLIAENFDKDLSQLESSHIRHNTDLMMDSSMLRNQVVYAQVEKQEVSSSENVRYRIDELINDKNDESQKTSFLKRVKRVVSANQKIKQDKRNIYLWDRDESILAWALLLENETLPQSKEDESIVNLSNLLGKIGRLRSSDRR
jgi:ATP-dependent Lon protease